MVVDLLAITNNTQFKTDSKLKSMITKCSIGGEDCILIKPTTYMNLSGEAVSAVLNYYKINTEDFFVIYDDISLDLGKLRFRPSGSDGGHNGIKSLIKHIGTNKFDRLKFGIGPQPPIPAENFVLQNFSKEQETLLKNTLKTAAEAIEFYLKNGIEKSQNNYN